jgi:uncharacterized glyoxalase superfamily protein PhnB
MPRITPYLHYEDVAAALEWLTRACGFAERIRLKDAEGRVVHAEMTYDDGVVMLGWPGPGYRCPRSLGARTQGLYVYVADVDAHFAHARERGATILAEPADQFYGDRNYRLEDPEGHSWTFGQHVRDVSDQEIAAGNQ